MSKGKIKVTEEQRKSLYDPNTFYNHGDNPALKRLTEIMVENTAEGKQIDHRTYVVNKLKKLYPARNFDDFLQRDLKAINFVRAFGYWMCANLALGTAMNLRKQFLPIGTKGITKLQQTSLYYSWGYLGVAGFGLYFFGTIYLWWKTTKFTADKFYNHVLLGERNWLYEQERQNNSYGLYYFKDAPFSCEENFPDLARAEFAKKKWPKPEWAA